MANPHRPYALRALSFLSLLTLAAGAGGTATPTHAQPEGGVVAVVNGRRITQKEVDSSIASQLLPLQEQIHALRKKALDNLILRAILEAEAERRGVSVEGLRRQLTAGKVDVAPSQVEQLYLENAATFAAMSPDEAKERLRLDLESQARMRNYREALAKLKETASVDLLLDEPGLLSVGGVETAPSLGPERAPVVIIEFSDFQCSYCKSAQATLKRVLQDYRNHVKLIFKHLPLTDTHPRALPAAQAAFCAGRQGSFWQFHDALFASENLSPEAFDEIAARLNLNSAEFKTCLDSEAARAAVIGDVQEAKRIGITGTPAFIINGRLVRGALSFEGFKDIIERELRAAHRGSANK